MAETATTHKIRLTVQGGQSEELEVESGATFRDVMEASDVLDGVQYDLVTEDKDGKKRNINADDVVDDYIHRENQEVFATPQDPVA